MRDPAMEKAVEAAMRAYLVPPDPDRPAVRDSPTQLEQALTAALSSLSEQGWVLSQGWRDISTAPKDGTRVLLGRFTGRKHDHDGLVKVDWYRLPGDDAGYIGFGHFNARHWPPTHWQPLPPAPSQGGGQ